MQKIFPSKYMDSKVNEHDKQTNEKLDKLVKKQEKPKERPKEGP